MSNLFAVYSNTVCYPATNHSTLCVEHLVSFYYVKSILYVAIFLIIELATMHIMCVLLFLSVLKIMVDSLILRD